MFILAHSQRTVTLVDCAHAMPLRRLRILLAEDDALIAMLAEDELVSRGHAVVHARDGLDALDCMARLSPFDAVITDVQMPRLRGGDLARRLRAERPDLPILVVSGHYSPETE